MSLPLLDRPLTEVPYLVIDVETTGVHRRTDRIVEISAVLVAPGRGPRVVLDTVVDPRRSLGAHEIHQLTPEHLAGAPVFSDLVPTLQALLANRVVVAHNAAFDVGFLREALWRTGYDDGFPWLCTMRLPRALGEGSGRWPLWFACSRAGFRLDDAHTARADALATAHLLRHQLNRPRGLRTLRELTERAHNQGLEDAWLGALATPPWPAPALIIERGRSRLRPRKRTPESYRPQGPVDRYLSAVVRVVSDLRLADNALDSLNTLRDELQLETEQTNAVYSAIYRGAHRRYAEDGVVDAVEQRHLDRLDFCLRFLGWTNAHMDA